MIPKVWLINILLLAAVLYMGSEGYSVWSQGYDLPVPASDRSDRKVAQQAYRGSMTPNRIQGPAAYELIASSDLFSSDRKEYIHEEPAEEPVEVIQEAPPLKDLKEKIYLQGVVIMGGYKKALITNPYRKKNSDPMTLTVQENDMVEAMKIESILKDRVVVIKNNERYEIKLFDEKKPPRKIIAKSAGKNSQVVSTGHQADSGKKQAARPSPSPSATAKPQNPGAGAVKSAGKKEGEQEFEYINTPFGKVRRFKRK